MSGKRPPAAERRVKIDRLVEHVMAGARVEDAADVLNIPRRTAYDLLRTPEAQETLARAHREIVERTARLVASANVAALRTLVRAMTEAPRWSDRVNAARAIVQIGARHVVEVTGANGGPIEVSTVDHLDRIIETTARRLSAVTIVDDDPEQPAIASA